MSLSDVFDTEPHDVVVVTEDPQLPAVVDDETVVDVDFNTARNNQYDLLTMGMASLNTAMRVASESENPRAIEVLAGMLKTVSEMNKQLVVMSKDREEVKTERVNRKSGGPVATPTIGHQNNLFVASSADINKLLAEKMKEQQQ